MAMNGDYGLIDIGHVCLDAANEAREFLGNGVTDGIRDIHRRGPGVYDALNDLIHEGGIGPRRVLQGKLNVAAEVSRVANHGDSLLIDLIRGFLELIFHMKGARGEEGMNTR